MKKFSYVIVLVKVLSVGEVCAMIRSLSMNVKRRNPVEVPWVWHKKWAFHSWQNSTTHFYKILRNLIRKLLAGYGHETVYGNSEALCMEIVDMTMYSFITMVHRPITQYEDFVDIEKFNPLYTFIDRSVKNMYSHESLASVQFDQHILFYDVRSERKIEIEWFFWSEKCTRALSLLVEPTYISLGGDGLFVHVGKMAYEDNYGLLGLNFWNRGFLVHDPSILDRACHAVLECYPLLEVNLAIHAQKYRWFAFNEVYITRAGDASTITLRIQSGSIGDTIFTGDGIMIATPAGSTGWSRSYWGITIERWKSLFAITPVGKISECTFSPQVLPEGELIYIEKSAHRNAPIDVLLDNRRLVSMECWTLSLTITLAPQRVRVYAILPL